MLIELGLNNPDFMESFSVYLNDLDNYVLGCALGAAYVGLIGNPYKALELFREKCFFDNSINRSCDAQLFFAKELDVHLHKIIIIDEIHLKNRSAREIAKILKEEKLMKAMD